MEEEYRCWGGPMRVKGTVIVDLVKTIKSRPDFNWGVYLEPRDFEIINSIVLATNWYDGGFFWRASLAIGEFIGRNDLGASFDFGRTCARSYLAVYKRLIVSGQPMKSLENFINAWESFYDVQGKAYRPMEIEGNGTGATIHAWDYPGMNPPAVRPRYFHALAGYFQEIAERSGCSRVTHTITDLSDHFRMTYRW